MTQILEFSSTRERALEQLERNMGSPFLAWLHDPAMTEIMLNPDGQIWLEKQGEPMQIAGSMPPATALAIIQTVAGYHKLEVTYKTPSIECQLPLDGSRFSGQIPPIVRAPTFTIRKLPHRVYSLAEFVQQGILTMRQKEILAEAVSQRENILVIGETGSGKTTFTNGLINQIVLDNPEERILIIEDTPEIRCAAQNCIQYHTSPDVGIEQMLRISLRMRPDTLIVGEIRGAEAALLLNAWMTGHKGFATMHAGHPAEALTRLSYLVSSGSRAASRDISQIVAMTVNHVVHIEKDMDTQTRSIRSIVKVRGYEQSGFLLDHY